MLVPSVALGDGNSEAEAERAGKSELERCLVSVGKAVKELEKENVGIRFRLCKYYSVSA